MSDPTDAPPGLDALFNAPAEFTHGGRTFRVGELTLAERAEFVRWLKDRAEQQFLRLPEDGPAVAKEALARELLAAMAAGDYEWGGPVCVRAMGTRAGGSQLIYLAVRQHDDLFTPEEAEALWDAAMNDRLAKLLARAVSDPPA